MVSCSIFVACQTVANNEFLFQQLQTLHEKEILAANFREPHLTDVTSVDVNNLIPVVSESLSMAVPSTGADAVVDDHASNVWASGAATAAFDAFDDHVPAVAVDEVHTMADHLVTEPDAGVQPGLDVLADAGVPDRRGCRRPVAAVRRPGDRRCAGHRRS